MASIQCGHCGRPLRARLDLETQGCAACGAAEAFPSHVAARIKAARAALLLSDARRRQLSRQQREAITDGRRLLVVLGLVVLVALLPFGGCAASALARERPTTGGDLALRFAMLLAMAGVGAFAIGAFERARRRLPLACAALPPLVAGEHADCHVCGGPLAGTSGIARCAFCSADNLLDPALMARAQTREQQGVEGLEAAVRREAGSLGTSLGFLMGAVLGAVVGVPIWVFGAYFVLLFVGSCFERPVDDTLRYATIETPEGRCVGQVVGSEVKPGYGKAQPLGSATSYPASALVGATMRPRGSQERAKVEKVVEVPLNGNHAILDSGPSRKQGITDLCE